MALAWVGFKAPGRAASALLVALQLCGCSVAIPLPGLSDKASDEDVTGSIAKPVSPLSRRLDEEDWRRAKAALATALDPQGSGAPVSWDNPASKAKGSIAPVALPYPVDGRVCRAFVAKIDTSKGHEDMQGAACRISGDDWDVNNVKPWTR
ncbi:MAG: hypothetical protein KGL46_07855 [Hyphomicrobiales bacterium]|nr:hypothetical protein [Hyphomicrobiales bacterium]